ncbi:hypothetical protein NKG05_24000 [Oerskovia sp. M15]
MILALIVLRFMPETLETARRRSGDRQRLPRVRDAPARPTLRRPGGAPGLGMAVLMSYVVGSPFVLQEGTA